MAVNIFGRGNNNCYDIVRGLDLNNNTIHNLKDPENEHDVANKRYVDSKSSDGDGWTIAGNALQSDGKLGTLNGNSFTLVRNNIPQIMFVSNHILARNMITWKNSVDQPIIFAGSTGKEEPF